MVKRIPAWLATGWVAPVFVLMWSTGFIGARYGMPYAEPATFLSIRFGAVLALVAPAVILMGVPFPSKRQAGHIAVSGMLLQGGYLLGVFEAVRHGMGAGLAALIVGLQPVLTAMLGALVAERVTGRQWTGLALGLGGVALVVWERLTLSGLSLLSLAMAVVALVSITAGTMYQKRFAPSFDLRIGSVIQFSAALLLVVPVAMLSETSEIDWEPELIGAFVWSILALSLGATSLLFVLIRRGAATRVASLMYLTPGVTAVMAWALFGERFSMLMVAGLALAALGVLTIMGRARIRPLAR